jgi:ATP-dependent Lon protease
MAKKQPKKALKAESQATNPPVEQDPPNPEASGIVLARDLMPEALPVIPLNERPVFPKMTVPVIIDNAHLAQAIIKWVESGSRYVALVLRQPPQEDNPDKNLPPLYKVGTVAEVIRMAKSDSGREIQVLLNAVQRCEIKKFVRDDPFIVARVDYISEPEMSDNLDLKAYSLSVVRSIKELILLNPLYKEELSIFMQHSNIQDPGRLCDFAAALTTAKPAQLQEVLETFRIRDRLKKVLALLKHELEITQLQARITSEIEGNMTRAQRNFFLREQLKAIKKELGIEKEGKDTEIERFEKRIEKLKLTEEARARINEEMEKFRLLEPASPEFSVTRNYLEWLTVLPWGLASNDSVDLARAEKVLNADHYGLEDVKERILEFLAVAKLKGAISGSILCFVGPPGVGKTSIGKSIASSINREFYRFSLGGMRDEAEIKGHRRTYIGAMPGKFIQAIKHCATNNPVIMLDEIDKIGASFHGDPASALLEVLDPEQNALFLDHYLDVRFDLSNVFFVCTANQLDTIPRPLLDRMEVIKLAGYILEEKLQIAKRYLLPKQIKAHGLKSRHIKLTLAGLREIIDGYAREPGVRNLENQIKKICRKVARDVARDPGENDQTHTIDAPDIVQYLGQRVFHDENAFSEPAPGIVTGLAWTSLGGDTLHIEAAKLHTGKSSFKQTGQLGQVMVESSEIAYSFARGWLDHNEEARKVFAESSFHLHVPAGATPKDGPSAGITMALALASLVLDQPISPTLAMTGELSLTGQVMPIGGVKEKTIAAKRAKIKDIIFPEENRKDFEELPPHIRKGIKPHFVRTFDEVARIALGQHNT